jgi:hypothetical protein
MPIHIRTWLGRLSAQCPGWYFWYGSDVTGGDLWPPSLPHRAE